jgi:type VI secretion system protein VasG
LRYGDEVVKLIASRCTEPESGGRMIDAILTNTLLPQISREFLTRLSGGLATRAVTISVQDGEFGCAFE